MAVRPGLANSTSRALTGLVHAESLDSSKSLCSYDLHGRCATPICKDLHLDDWDSESVDVEKFFKSRFEPERLVTMDMFNQAITAALTVYNGKISDGRNSAEESLRAFVLSMLPMCRPKLK